MRNKGMMLAAVLVVSCTAASLIVNAYASDSPPAAKTPSFSSLDGLPKVSAPPALRSALTAATVPAEADLRVLSASDTDIVSVSRANDTYWLSIYNRTMSRTTTVQTKGADITANAGTWAVAGGSSGEAAAVLVPDGVTSVTVESSAAKAQTIPVTHGIAFIRQDGPFKVRYDADGPRSFEANSSLKP